jgi:hypothetical protein
VLDGNLRNLLTAIREVFTRHDPNATPTLRARLNEKTAELVSGYFEKLVNVIANKHLRSAAEINGALEAIIVGILIDVHAEILGSRNAFFRPDERDVEFLLGVAQGFNEYGLRVSGFDASTADVVHDDGDPTAESSSTHGDTSTAVVERQPKTAATGKSSVKHRTPEAQRRDLLHAYEVRLETMPQCKEFCERFRDDMGQFTFVSACIIWYAANRKRGDECLRLLNVGKLVVALDSEWNKISAAITNQDIASERDLLHNVGGAVGVASDKICKVLFGEYAYVSFPGLRNAIDQAVRCSEIYATRSAELPQDDQPWRRTRRRS